MWNVRVRPAGGGSVQTLRYHGGSAEELKLRIERGGTHTVVGEPWPGVEGRNRPISDSAYKCSGCSWTGSDPKKIGGGEYCPKCGQEVVPPGYSKVSSRAKDAKPNTDCVYF